MNQLTNSRFASAVTFMFLLFTTQARRTKRPGMKKAITTGLALLLVSHGYFIGVGPSNYLDGVGCCV